MAETVAASASEWANHHSLALEGIVDAVGVGDRLRDVFLIDEIDLQQYLAGAVGSGVGGVVA